MLMIKFTIWASAGVFARSSRILKSFFLLTESNAFLRSSDTKIFRRVVLRLLTAILFNKIARFFYVDNPAWNPDWYDLLPSSSVESDSSLILTAFSATFIRWLAITIGLDSSRLASLQRVLLRTISFISLKYSGSLLELRAVWRKVIHLALISACSFRVVPSKRSGPNPLLKFV